MPLGYKPWHKEFLTDPGIDGGGIRRDITRDTQVAKRLLVQASPCGWDWILRSIWSKTPAECASVDLLDTAVCEAGAIQYYMFTSSTGQVMRKNQRFAALSCVREEFLRIALSAYEPDLLFGSAATSETTAAKVAAIIPPEAPVCLVHKMSGEVAPLSLSKFDALCKSGAPPADAIALQAFVAHKDSVAESRVRIEQGGSKRVAPPHVHDFLANFCHEYKLNAVGVPTNAYIRLGVNPSLAGSSGGHGGFSGGVEKGSSIPEGHRVGSTSMTSHNKPINRRMDAMALAIVRQIERRKKARVVHMVTEFVVDAQR